MESDLSKENKSTSKRGRPPGQNTNDNNEPSTSSQRDEQTGETTNVNDIPQFAETVNVFTGPVEVHETHHHHQDRHQKYDVRASEELEEKLKRLLLEAAQKESSKIASPVKLERALVAVPIHMTINPRRLTEHGHFTRREDLDQIYRGHDGGQVSPNELFKKAKEKAKEEAKNKRLDTKAKEEYIEKQENVVGIVGQAGIGKTTFQRTYTQKVISTDSCLEVSFVFFISIRNLDFSSKQKNLLHFLLHSILSEWKHDEESDRFLLEKISKDPKTKVTLDGLDEADVKDFKKKVPKVNMYEKASTWAFLVNLINGNLLPLARKIITSRPNQLYSLHADHRPNFLTEILGLDANGRDALGQQICGVRYPEIKESISANDNLQAIMYVPVNCILTFSFLMNKTEDLSSVTFTQVLAFTCSQYATSPDHNRGQSDLQLDKLAKFAWNSYKERKYVFQLHDLEEAGIAQSIISSFLHTSVTKLTNLQVTILEGYKQLYFPHLVMHEFYAAVHLVYKMSDEEFSTSLQLLSEDQYEVVGRFAFGLLKENIIKQLKPLFKTSNVASKKEKMKKYVVDMCKSGFKLNHLSLVHEANNDDITKAVADVISSHHDGVLDLSKSTFYPTDSNSLTNILQFVPSSSINMSSCHFRGGGFDRFAQHVADKNIEKLDISENNQLGNRCVQPLAGCIHRIQELKLSNCGITNIEPLAQSIASLQQPTKRLDISGDDQLGYSCVRPLAGCIHRIQELDLRSCGITDIEPLAQSIATLQQPIKKLVISENWELENSCVRPLAGCIHRIQELDLRSCGITDIEPLAQSIASLQQPIKLNISWNKQLGNSCVRPLAGCIHRIQELDLSDCDITDIEPLAQSIASLQQPIKKLDISANELGNSCVRPLAGCIHRIQELGLSRCRITDIEPLAQSIELLQQPIKKLDISRNEQLGNIGGNRFGNSCVQPLACCIHRIQELNLSWCGITDIEPLAQSIASLQQPMMKLSVWGNDIGIKGARSLANCLEKIETLWLTRYYIKADGEKLLKSKLKQLNLPESRIEFY